MIEEGIKEVRLMLDELVSESDAVLSKRIEEVRLVLNELSSRSEAILYEGKVLEISKKLDMLIYNYYKQNES